MNTTIQNSAAASDQSSAAESGRRNAAESAATARGLDHSFASSIAWTGASKWGVQLVSWLATFVVARFLTPEDYGLVGMATVFLGLVTLLTESGIGISVITLRELDDDQVAQFNGLAVLLGLAGFGVTFAMAEPLGRFFRSPELPDVVRVLSATFLITGFKTIPNALLQKDLRFKTLALLEGASGLVLAAFSITLAIAGFRYWTLVWAGVLSAAISTALAVWIRPYAIRPPRWSALRDALRFTRHQLVGSLSWYTYSNSDFLVAGRVLGKAELGVYTLGWTIAHAVSDRVTDLTTRVTPAFFSLLQTDRAGLRRYLLRLNEALAIVVFPALAGLGLLAADFIPLALGDHWAGAVTPLRVLLLYAAVNSGTFLISRVLTAQRETRFLMWMGIAQAVVMPIGFLVGSRWGAGGIAMAWVALFPIVRLPVFLRVSRTLDLSAASYLGAFLPALSGCVPMVGLVIFLDAALPPSVPVAASLAIRAVCGALVYAGILSVLYRRRVAAIIDLFRRRGQPLPTPAS